MKSLVVYSSQTGNTRRLAEAVFDTLQQEKEIFPVNEAPDPKDYDLIALGFWVQSGKPDPKSAEYLSKIGSNQVFLFATHGAAADSAHAHNAMQSAKDAAPNSVIVGTFNCPGEVNPKVLEKVRAKPEPPVWLDDAPSAVGHPDETDVRALKQRVAELVG